MRRFKSSAPPPLALTLRESSSPFEPIPFSRKCLGCVDTPFVGTICLLLLPHQLYTSNIDEAISFIGKADFCRTRLSEFKKIQRSLWAKLPHPSGRTIRGNLHANKSLNYLRVVLQISLCTSSLVSFSQCLRYIVAVIESLYLFFHIFGKRKILLIIAKSFNEKRRGFWILLDVFTLFRRISVIPFRGIGTGYCTVALFDAWSTRRKSFSTTKGIISAPA